MQQDQNMERAVNPIDSDDAAIRASDRDEELGFLWGKIYIVVILINVLFALSSLVLNTIDPAEYASATPPISKAYFIAIALIGSLSGLGLLSKARVGLYATLVVFSFFALLGLVVILNMNIVGLAQGVVCFGIAFLGFRYFWRRRAILLRKPEERIKRIQLAEYCEGMLKHVFSPHYDEIADRLLYACPTGYREAIDRDWYLKNFRAAVLQLLGVAFSRKLQRGQRCDAELLLGSFLKTGAHKEVERLYRQYNSAFGSDFEDGVRGMASLFARSCVVPDVDPGKVQGLHYDAFYGVLRAFFENINSVKVV